MFISLLPVLVANGISSIWYFEREIPNALAIYNAIAGLHLFTNPVTNALIILYQNKKSREWLAKYFNTYFKIKDGEEENNDIVAMRNIEMNRELKFMKKMIRITAVDKIKNINGSMQLVIHMA